MLNRQPRGRLYYRALYLSYYVGNTDNIGCDCPVEWVAHNSHTAAGTRIEVPA